MGFQAWKLTYASACKFIYAPAFHTLASHAVVFRGLVLLLWEGGNTSPLKTTAWEAIHTSTLILFTMFTPVKPVMKFTPVRTLNLRDSGNRPLGAASVKAMVTCR